MPKANITPFFLDKIMSTVSPGKEAVAEAVTKASIADNGATETGAAARVNDTNNTNNTNNTSNSSDCAATLPNNNHKALKASDSLDSLESSSQQCENATIQQDSLDTQDSQNVDNKDQNDDNNLIASSSLNEKDTKQEAPESPKSVQDSENNAVAVNPKTNDLNLENQKDFDSLNVSTNKPLALIPKQQQPEQVDQTESKTMKDPSDPNFELDLGIVSLDQLADQPCINATKEPETQLLPENQLQIDTHLQPEIQPIPLENATNSATTDTLNTLGTTTKPQELQDTQPSVLASVVESVSVHEPASEPSQPSPQSLSSLPSQPSQPQTSKPVLDIEVPDLENPLEIPNQPENVEASNALNALTASNVSTALETSTALLPDATDSFTKPENVVESSDNGSGQLKDSVDDNLKSETEEPQKQALDMVNSESLGGRLADDTLNTTATTVTSISTTNDSNQDLSKNEGVTKDLDSIKSASLPTINTNDLEDKTVVESLALATSTSISESTSTSTFKPTSASTLISSSTGILDSTNPPKPRKELDLTPSEIILPKSLELDLSKDSPKALIPGPVTGDSQIQIPSTTNIADTVIKDTSIQDTAIPDKPSDSIVGEENVQNVTYHQQTSQQQQPMDVDQIYINVSQQALDVGQQVMNVQEQGDVELPESSSKGFFEALEGLNLKDFNKEFKDLDTQMKDFDKFDGLNFKDFKDFDKLDHSLLSAKLPESLDAMEDMDMANVDSHPDSNADISIHDTPLSDIPGLADVHARLSIPLPDIPNSSNIQLDNNSDNDGNSNNSDALLQFRKNIPIRAQSEALTTTSSNIPKIDTNLQAVSASVPHSPTIPLPQLEDFKILQDLQQSLPLSTTLSTSTATPELPLDEILANKDLSTSTLQGKPDSNNINNTSDTNLNHISNDGLANTTSELVYDETTEQPAYQLSNSVAPMLAPGNTGTMTPGAFSQSPSLLPTDSASGGGGVVAGGNSGDDQFNKRIDSFKSTSPYQIHSPRFSRSISDKSSTLQAINALNLVTGNKNGADGGNDNNNNGTVDNETNLTDTDGLSGLTSLQGILPVTSFRNNPNNDTDAGDDNVPRVSAYARLDFSTFIFYVQTLQVILGRSGNNNAQSIVDIDLGPIKAISRKHAKIFYNFGTQRFELSVLGRNGAFVDDDFVELGSTVPLKDG